MPSYTVRPGLTLELHETERAPRTSLTLADYDALADIDVSDVKETSRRIRRGRLIQCRIYSPKEETDVVQPHPASLPVPPAESPDTDGGADSGDE